MKQLFFTLVVTMIGFSSCGLDSNSGNNDSNLRFTPEHFRIPLPTGIYVPKGLHQMNMKEMIQAKEKTDFKFDMPIKDFNGNLITQDSVMKSIKPYFIQLYSNDSGRIVEGVAFFITRDFQKAIVEWK